MDTVYRSLQKHLDRLPAGFPATDSGVEIRILKKLFTPEEAALAVHLTMKAEPAATIAKRAGLDEMEVTDRLAEMVRKGLLFSRITEGRPPVFMASQFMIGIWEYHVNDLDAEFIRDMDEYTPMLTKEAFDPLPQLRIVPVGRSVKTDLKVLSYEHAEALVSQQSKYLVAPCICRKEHQIKGDGCDKLMEACLIFGLTADFYQRKGLGRMISLEETLEILQTAEKQGLVLQPSNTEQITNICCCCGDCCQVLLNLKRHPIPAATVASPFTAFLEANLCSGCEICHGRCQMDALSMAGEAASLDADRCIGCGLCVSTCPTGALTLKRKSIDLQPVIPKNHQEAFSMRLERRKTAQTDLLEKVQRYQKAKTRN